MLDRHSRDLWAAFVDGPVNDEDASRLADVLRASAERRGDFLNDLAMAGMLQQLAVAPGDFLRAFAERIKAEGDGQELCRRVLERVTELTPETPEGDRTSVGRWRFTSWLGLPLAAAAALVVAVGVWWMVGGRSSAVGGQVIARVERVSGFSVQCSGKNEKKQLATGDEIRAGARIETGEGGMVKLAWVKESTTVELVEHSSFSILHSTLSRLALGRLTATVAKQEPSKPFVVETPHARATVLGTRFTLRVSEGRRNVSGMAMGSSPETRNLTPETSSCTRLDVVEGLVRLTRLGDHRCVDVSAGERAEVKAGEAGPEPPVKQAVKAGDVVRSFPFRGAGGLTFDGHWVWVADGNRRLWKLDPESGREIGSLDVGFKCQGVEWDGEKFWVVEGQASRVHAIDPATGRSLLSFSVPKDASGNVADGVAFGDGCLWVSAGSEIFKIDSRDGRLLKTLKPALFMNQTDLAYFDGAIWCRTRDLQRARPGEDGPASMGQCMEVCRIDPETGLVLGRFDAPPVKDAGLNWVSGLAGDGAGRMWVSVSQRLYLIETGDVAWNEYRTP